MCVFNCVCSVRERGFALLSTLSLVVLLALAAFSMLVLTSLSVRSKGEGKSEQVARENAKFALMEALGQLQEVAGADQRATATGSVMSTALTVPDERLNWVGVWDTSAYYPDAPEEKTFMRWLVSYQGGGVVTELSALEGALQDPVVIFEGYRESDNVEVDKVSVYEDETVVGKYAYWVSDEGGKADLSWGEYHSVDLGGGTAQLTSIPGVDPSYFSNNTEEVNSPLSEEASDLYLAALSTKVITPHSLSLANQHNASDAEWLQYNHHHMTVGSYGVLADMKDGGLKWDLSMAFEMDGDKDYLTSSEDLFNRQEGVFVGGDDRLGGKAVPEGLAVEPRYLYRDTVDDRSLFSADMADTPYGAGHYASVRGPNWWSLRDYANMYKRLEVGGGSMSMEPRAYFPARYGYTDLQRGDNRRGSRPNTSNRGMDVWNSEFSKDMRYIPKPAAGSYGPALLGTTFVYSVRGERQADGSEHVQLIADPVFYIWNPFNLTLNCSEVTIDLGKGMPGYIGISAGGEERSGSIAGMIRNGGGTAQGLRFSMSADLEMEPGEVVVLTPASGHTWESGPYSLTHYPSLEIGYNMNESTGIIIEDFSGMGESGGAGKLPVDEEGVEVAFDLAMMSNAYAYRATLSTSVGGHHTVAFWEFANEDAEHCYLAHYEGDHQIEFDRSDLGNKNFFGASSYLSKPTDDFLLPVEVFAQFNPMAYSGSEYRFPRRTDPNFSYRMANTDIGFNNIYGQLGFDYPMGQRNGYWGESFSDTGSTHLVMKEVPSRPLTSLAQFMNAPLSFSTIEPMNAIGNSFASIFTARTSPYAVIQDSLNVAGVTVADHSWLANDALFDAYFLSGVAPAYENNAGYRATGTMAETLSAFYEGESALEVGNAMLPYVPAGKNVEEILEELAGEDGYLKLGAYSLLRGQFNINSTSVHAWAALLRANRDLTVGYANGGENERSGTPFPSSSDPTFVSEAKEFWTGFSRISDADILSLNDPTTESDDTGLAVEIVKQVKARAASSGGPFMSLSDFVNRRLSDDEYGEMGALQSALEASEVNAEVRATSLAPTVDYESGAFAEYYPEPIPSRGRKTTTGIAGDITQAKILIPLAPRLNARSDTFKVRCYGEAVENGEVVAQAVCEAIVQRLPEYIDPSNESWDEDFSRALPYSERVSENTLSELNARFGRRFKIISLKWL